MGCFSAKRLEKTVIIIGGGPAGIKLAASLDSQLNVILVEKRSALVHCVAGLRAMVSPSNCSLVIPYDYLLKHGRVVTGEVVELRKDGEKWTAVLGSGEELKGDVVVLATGSGCAQAQLGRSGNLNTPEEIKGYFKSVQDKVSRASNIVVVGGGPVGVEMVGELKHFYPEKNVTLVHNGPSLVSNPNSMANPKFQKRMLDIVQKSGAHVILDDSVDRTLFKGDEWIVEGPLTINTSKGVSLTGVDLLFKAVGVPKPSGRLLSSSCFEKGKQLDNDGYFIVNKHYQVVDKAGLFALGDCLTYHSEAKTIVAIMFRLGVVVKNVIAACNGQPLKGVVPRQKWSAMFVPFGPKDGAGYAGSTTLPKFMVVSGKAKDLFIPKTWKEMGFSKPQ
jgi:NADH dehydrogenase FAD-containing subunit